MSVTGEADRPPVRVGVSIIDMGTGMWCAVGILAALNRRAATGVGCVVDASLYETALGWMTIPTSMVQVDGRNPEKQGSGARGLAPYQAYQCADGYLVIAAPNDRLFAKLAAVLGHPEWPGDPRFDTNQNRYQHLEALNALIEPLVAAQPRDHWQSRFDAVGLPSAPARSTTEMLADEQTLALGMLQNLPDDPMQLMGLPLSFDGERPPLRSAAPALGEHDAEVKRTVTDED